MIKLEDLKEPINKAQKIALFCHINIDFDCIGSMYGLKYILESLGKKVDLYSNDPLTLQQKLIFDDVLKFDTDGKKYDLLISVDTSTLDRLGRFDGFFAKHKNTIKIDHHSFGDDYAKINYVNCKSSNCENILDLCKVLGVKLSPQIATALYSGLLSDTSSFSNSSTNIHSFQTALALCKAGADILAISNAITNFCTPVGVKMKRFLYNNYKIYDDIAFILISNKDLKKNKAIKSDCENFSDILRSIDGVNISCSIIEKDKNIFTCSFRAMPGYNVAEIAQKFGGGGHIPAAGCTIKAKNILQVKTMVLKEIHKSLGRVTCKH